MSARSEASSPLDRFARQVVASGWPWGTLLTVGFYAALPHLPVYQQDAQRYFTAHWIEYATTWLFFVGMATLCIKALRIPRERSALHADLFDGLTVEPAASPVLMVERLGTHLRLVARRSSDSYLVKRLRDVCEYVMSRRSADGLEGQLNYLAELSSGRLHDSYSLIRTITWAVPILGFLGTVIGITMAIANVTPDQLESSLTDVTAGLAVAFDTTALSLALSMILVFGTFLIEGQEQQILDDVEDFAMRRVLALFPQHQEAASPLLQAETTAAQQLLERTETLISWQMQEWQQGLEALRSRWSGTLQKQQEHLDLALQSGLQATLTEHAASLDAVRGEFLTAFQQAVIGLTQSATDAQERWQAQHTQSLAELQTAAETIRDSWSRLQDHQSTLWNDVGEGLSNRYRDWADRLQPATEALTGQLTELRQQGEVLLRIVEQEEHLVRLEDHLTRNLDSVRVAETLEETLLNLNAAVHLLSSRTRKAA